MTEVRVINKVPPDSAFGNTEGRGTALVIDSTTDIPYYYKKGAGRTSLVDPQAVKAGYGGMAKTVNQTVANLGAGWQTIETYTTERPAIPVGVVVDLVAGSLKVTEIGVYQITVSLALVFVEVNNARTYNLRVYDLTAGIPLGDTVPVAVGRNTAGSNVSATVIVQANATSNQLVIQMGGGDAFTGVHIANAGFYINRVSP